MLPQMYQNLAMRPKEIAVSFSGGATSAYMAHQLLELEKRGGEIVVRYILFANTGREHEATLKFILDCQEYWQREIIWLEYAGRKKEEGLYYDVVNFQTASRRGEPFEALIEKRGYLPNVVTRFCTQELKVRVIEKFLNHVGCKDIVQAVGIRHDEPLRYYRIKQQENRWMPLFEWGVSKQDVNTFWDKMPFKLQIPNYMGNCDLCFLKSRPKRVQILRQTPDVGEWWDRMEVLAYGKSKGKPRRKRNRLATFDKNASVMDLLALSKNPTIFDLEDYQDIPCSCNID